MPASPAAPAPQGVPAWGSGPDWSAQKPPAPESSSAPAQSKPQEAPRREVAHETAPAREAAPAQAEPRPAAPPQQSSESAAPQRSEAPAREAAPVQAEPRTDARPQQGHEPPAQQRSEAPARAEAPASGRDADMLRGRWNEVVERLSSISRVTWSMVGGNAQLGAVDGSRVVLLFPVEAMVNAFSRGPRAADVEKAINEVTGLTVSVSAQVGQASGGPATTGPSAQASHPGPAAQPSQPGGWVSEPPPFDEAAAQAAPHGDPEPADTGWPEPARAPELQPAPEPEDAGWPEPATVTPIRRDEPIAPAAAPIAQVEDPRPAERPAMPERAARALAQVSAEAPEASQASSPSGDAAPRKHSFTVFRYPGDPEPTEQPAGAPAQAEPASSPVFDDAPIEPAAHTPSTPTGWGDPVVIPGGASVNFDDGADSWTPPESSAPADVTPISAAPSAPTQAPAWLAAAPEPTSDPTPGFGAPEPQRDASREPGTPLSGRAAAEAALRERAQREAAVVSPRTHAADDDSASIDDENIENSQTIGLAAVLEILGGRVIEEKMTEGGY